MATLGKDYSEKGADLRHGQEGEEKQVTHLYYMMRVEMRKHGILHVSTANSTRPKSVQAMFKSVLIINGI